jgi:ketosteroid isomerase-like protein
MRTSLLLLAAGMAASSSNVTYAADREALKAELVRTEAEFFQHALANGFSEGLRSYMADDALIANSLILGRDAQEARMKQEPAKARPNVIRWKPLRAEVAASGDLGYTWGVAESGPSKEGPFKPYGIYVTIWKRQTDGKWKFVYDAATILTADAIEKFLREKFPEAAAAAPAR